MNDQKTNNALTESRLNVGLERTSGYEPPTYQMYGVMNALKDVLRQHLRPGEILMWRDAFRWHNDTGVLSNHYECMGLRQLCEDFGYEVVHDFNHVAVVVRSNVK